MSASWARPTSRSSSASRTSSNLSSCRRHRPVEALTGHPEQETSLEMPLYSGPSLEPCRSRAHLACLCRFHPCPLYLRPFSSTLQTEEEERSSSRRPSSATGLGPRATRRPSPFSPSRSAKSPLQSSTRLRTVTSRSPSCCRRISWASKAKGQRSRFAEHTVLKHNRISPLQCAALGMRPLGWRRASWTCSCRV